MLYRRITLLRQQAHMSRPQLAEALHVSARTISMYEQGRQSPGLDVLIRMSYVFDVSLDYLVAGMDFTSSADVYVSSRSAENCPCNTCCWKEYKLRHLR